MGMGPVMAEGSIAIILILVNETTRRARWPVSIERTAYSAYFFLYVQYREIYALVTWERRSQEVEPHW